MGLLKLTKEEDILRLGHKADAQVRLATAFAKAARRHPAHRRALDVRRADALKNAWEHRRAVNELRDATPQKPPASPEKILSNLGALEYGLLRSAWAEAELEAVRLGNPDLDRDLRAAARAHFVDNALFALRHPVIALKAAAAHIDASLPKPPLGVRRPPV